MISYKTAHSKAEKQHIMGCRERERERRRLIRLKPATKIGFREERGKTKSKKERERKGIPYSDSK